MDNSVQQISNDFLIVFIFRHIQLFDSGLDVQTRVLLLSAHNLRPLLHACDRVVGFLLAGPQRCPRQSVAGRDHPPNHVNTDSFH